MKNLKSIAGQVLEALFNGGKIVRTGFDGLDHYLLVENPKGEDWKFTQYQTQRQFAEPGEEDKFFIMVHYNETAKATFKAFTEEYIRTGLHLHKHQPELLAAPAYTVTYPSFFPGEPDQTRAFKTLAEAEDCIAQNAMLGIKAVPKLNNTSQGS